MKLRDLQPTQESGRWVVKLGIGCEHENAEWDIAWL